VKLLTIRSLLERINDALEASFVGLEDRVIVEIYRDGSSDPLIIELDDDSVELENNVMTLYIDIDV